MKLTSSRPSDEVAPSDLSSAPMKPSLIVMFFASIGSGNKMEDMEFLELTKWSKLSKPILRMGKRDPLEEELWNKTIEIRLNIHEFITILLMRQEYNCWLVSMKSNRGMKISGFSDNKKKRFRSFQSPLEIPQFREHVNCLVQRFL